MHEDFILLHIVRERRDQLVVGVIARDDVCLGEEPRDKNPRKPSPRTEFENTQARALERAAREVLIEMEVVDVISKVQRGHPYGRCVQGPVCRLRVRCGQRDCEWCVKCVVVWDPSLLSWLSPEVGVGECGSGRRMGDRRVVVETLKRLSKNIFRIGHLRVDRSMNRKQDGASPEIGYIPSLPSRRAR